MRITGFSVAVLNTIWNKSKLTFQRECVPSWFSRSRLCTDKMSIRLFEEKNHAKLYAEFRPTYPASVYKVIHQYCTGGNESSRFDLAVDVGCGNGLSTVPLTKYFKKVIGSDISESQIQEARDSSSQIDFRVASAEDLSFLESGTVDLITTAQAFHWMDQDVFFKEVSRVLRPEGVIAVYGYGNCKADKEEAQSLIWQFYSETLCGYWHERREHINNKYSNYQLPYDGWERNDDLFIENSWSVDSFIGYVSSWSAWRTFLKQHPDAVHLQELRNKLKKIYTDKEERPVVVRFPVFILLGRKPT